MHAGGTPARGRFLCPVPVAQSPCGFEQCPAWPLCGQGSSRARIRPVGTHGSPTIWAAAGAGLNNRPRRFAGRAQPRALLTPGLGRSGPAADARCCFKARFPPKVCAGALQYNLAGRLGAQTPSRVRNRDCWAELGSTAELRCRSAPMRHRGPAGRSLSCHPKGSIWAVGWSRISKAAQEISRRVSCDTVALPLPQLRPGPGQGEEPQSGCWWRALG